MTHMTQSPYYCHHGFLACQHTSLTARTRRVAGLRQNYVTLKLLSSLVNHPSVHSQVVTEKKYDIM